MYKVVIKNTSWKPNYQKSDFWYLHKISHRFFCNLPLSRNKNDQPGINVISVKYEIRPKIKSNVWMYVWEAIICFFLVVSDVENGWVYH